MIIIFSPFGSTVEEVVLVSYLWEGLKFSYKGIQSCPFDKDNSSCKSVFCLEFCYNKQNCTEQITRTIHFPLCFITKIVDICRIYKENNFGIFFSSCLE